MPTKLHYYSIDVARIALIACLILTTYSGYVPFFSYAAILLNFAAGALFMLYGYLVLREDNDLKKNILHTLKVFIIFFVIDFIVSTGYMWFVYRNPFAYLTKRGIFNFLVLNVWGPAMGSHIWFIQALLYALIIIFILKKLNLFEKLCIPLCIICFIIAFFTGEGAGLINFNIAGYTYIPGNFLTRALPYMLLGKIIRDNREKISEISAGKNIAIFVGGILLCVGEFVLLLWLGKLGYYNHLLGFIPMAVAVLIWSMICFDIGEMSGNLSVAYKVMFYIYNPVAEILIIIALIVSQTVQTYNTFMIALPFVVVVLCVLIPVAICKLLEEIKRIKEEYNYNEEEE